MTPEEIQELFTKLVYVPSELPEIVRRGNLQRLAGYCLTRTYDQLIDDAKSEGVDIDELHVGLKVLLEELRD